MDRRQLLCAVGALGFAGPLHGRAVQAQPKDRPLDLSALEARHGGRIGLCMSSPAGQVSWRGGERFAYCSTFKLFLAAATLQRAQRGEERLDRAIPVTARDMVSYAPVTKTAVGASLTVEALCKAAVEVSDNPAANILIREMGGLDRWRAWYRSIGDDVTRVDRMETDLNSAIPGDPRDTTTPEQTVRNLAAVLGGRVLDASSLQRLQRWLIDTPTGAARIKAAIPPGYRLGHKTGTGAKGPANDIGIIWPPSGAPLLVAIYFAEAFDATPEQRDAVIADAARAALNAARVRG